MQTLSEFYQNWQPAISEQAKDVSSKIEKGQDMSRFLDLEPKMRSEVDALVREYSESLSVKPDNLSSLELGYLLHLRLWQALELAQFLEHCGFGETEMTAHDWIQFLAIDSWHELTVHKWRHDFGSFYSKRD